MESNLQSNPDKYENQVEAYLEKEYNELFEITKVDYNGVRNIEIRIKTLSDLPFSTKDRSPCDSFFAFPQVEKSSLTA